MRAWANAVLGSIDRGAWLRFLLALGGLMLAFATALLSTAARERGDLLATAVLATSSLLLATVVGVITVPYLAKRVVARRVREALNYDVTREGVIYLVLTVLIAVGALNTGNNLLFIVVAAMLGAVLISGVASAMVLTRLDVELLLPSHVFAGRSYSGSVQLRNSRRWLPSFSISVVPPPTKKKIVYRWRKSMFVYPPSKSGRAPWIRWPDLVLDRIPVGPALPPIFEGRVYLPYLPPRQTLSAELDLFFPHRGRYRQQGIGLSTRFPFSFLTKTRIVPLTEDVLVYPSVEPTPEFLEVLPMISGEMESYARGRGNDLYLIRDYQPEDTARHVDWKSTAKVGQLKVREFTREDERKLRIVFENPRPDELSTEDYESAVALAASLAWHFASEGTELSFIAAGYPQDSELYHFLEYLADVQPSEAGAVLETLSLTDEYNIVLTPRPRGSISTAAWESSYIIFLQK
jgi:uncharacterized protein (DUF58 family)